MTLAHIDAALGAYFRHKSGKDGIVGNPLPMLAEILALGDADRRDAERLEWLIVNHGDGYGGIEFPPSRTVPGYDVRANIDQQAAGGGE